MISAADGSYSPVIGDFINRPALYSKPNNKKNPEKNNQTK